MKKLKPIIAFAICLWAIAVVTYATQVRNDRKNGKLAGNEIVMAAGTSCGSSSSSTE